MRNWIKRHPIASLLLLGAFIGAAVFSCGLTLIPTALPAFLVMGYYAAPVMFAIAGAAVGMAMRSKLATFTFGVGGSVGGAMLALISPPVALLAFCAALMVGAGSLLSFVAGAIASLRPKRQTYTFKPPVFPPDVPPVKFSQSQPGSSTGLTADQLGLRQNVGHVHAVAIAAANVQANVAVPINQMVNPIPFDQFTTYQPAQAIAHTRVAAGPGPQSYDPRLTHAPAAFPGQPQVVVAHAAGAAPVAVTASASDDTTPVVAASAAAP